MQYRDIQYLTGCTLAVLMRILLIIFFLPVTLSAQSLRLGLAYTNIHDAPFIESYQAVLQPAFAVHLPFEWISIEPWAVEYEANLQIKGYNTYQTIEGKRALYKLRFPYLGQSLMLSRPVSHWLKAYAGLGVQVLFYPLIKNTEDNSRLRDTYSRLDLSGLVGLRFFHKARFSLDVRGTSSVLPILNYESFDNFGRPLGSQRGLRHMTLEVAALFNFLYTSKTSD